jgi:hypothetical protein
MKLINLAFAFVISSLCLTLGIWVWIFTRPPGTFHDQGGLAITFLYFPCAFFGWAFAALLAAWLLAETKRKATEFERPRITRARWLLLLLIFIGFLLAVGTLATA